MQLKDFSSLSPDAMTISLAFLYIAYILKLAFSKEEAFIGKKEIITLTVMSIIMSLCKIVYVPLVLLMFIIPKEKIQRLQKVKKNNCNNSNSSNYKFNMAWNFKYIFSTF